MSIVSKLLHLQKTYEKVQILKSHDLTLDTWQIDKVISLLSKDLWQLNLAGRWVQGGCSERKRLSRDRLLVFSYFPVLSRRSFWTEWQNYFK